MGSTVPRSYDFSANSRRSFLLDLRKFAAWQMHTAL